MKTEEELIFINGESTKIDPIIDAITKVNEYLVDEYVSSLQLKYTKTIEGGIIIYFYQVIDLE